MSTDEGTVVWDGRGGDFTLHVPPGVFRPTQTTKILADVLDLRPGDRVIDMGTGSGVLAIVAVKVGAAFCIGVDNAHAAVEAARANARAVGVAAMTDFREGELFAPVEGERVEVVIGDVAGIPTALARLTGWCDGGPTGIELPREMVRAAPDHLVPGGRMYLPTGSIQAEPTLLEQVRRAFGDENVRLVASEEVGFNPRWLKDPGIHSLVERGVVRFEEREEGGRRRRFWRINVWCCTKP